MKGGNGRRRCGRGILLWSEECEVINRRKTKLIHAFRGSATSGLKIVFLISAQVFGRF
jgi:hypothetical protein